MPLDTLPSNRLEAGEIHPHSRGCGAWAVVQTFPQAERWAAGNLAHEGYATYLPLLRVRRRDPVVRTLSRLVDVPLWAGYLFVQPGTNWHPIKRVRGVARLLLCDGRPGYIRCGLVEALRASEDARRSVAATNQWAPGVACVMAAGPFAGQHGVVASVGRDTARVALMVFGGIREVDVPIEWIEAR